MVDTAAVGLAVLGLVSLCLLGTGVRGVVVLVEDAASVLDADGDVAVIEGGGEVC